MDKTRVVLDPALIVGVVDLAWRSSETGTVGLDDGRAMVGPPEGSPR